MNRWLMVVPAIDPVVTSEFFRRLRLPLEDVLLVDNVAEPLMGNWPGRYHRAGHNLGVAASWNVGVDAVLGEARDWLVIVSTSTRFGPQGGRDFIAALDGCPPAASVCGALDLGWHLVAVRAEALRVVGRFDEGFWPGYWEETDWVYRASLVGMGGHHWVKVDVEYGEQAATLRAGLAPVNLQAMSDRYSAKWGGPRGAERFTVPWDGACPPDDGD